MTIADVTSYTELIGAVKAQVAALGLRYQDFDDLAGFPAGLSGKVFGGAQVKRLGPEKMFDAMRAAGLRIKLEPDPEQLAKMQARIAENFNPRQANQARPNNSASPVSSHLMGRVFKHFSRLGNKKRWSKTSKQDRSEHMRMMAMAGVRKRRKKKRRADRAKRAGVAHRAANAERAEA